MIKAIIFDCFGVLTSEGWQQFKETHFTDKPEALEEAQRLNALADSGKLNHAELIPMIAELANMSTEQALAEIDNYQPNLQLLNFIRDDLVSDYTISMLSNVSDDWLYSMFTPEQLDLFTFKLLSFEIGYSKPDPRAYEAAIEKCGVLPSECLFIDDLTHNVLAAKDAGMHSFIYEDFSLFKEELEKILAANSDK